MPSAKSTPATTDANVPCSQSTSTKDSVELITEQSTCSADRNATDLKTDDNTEAKMMADPPSLADLATQCVSSQGTVKRRAWADSPMEPAALQASSGLCYELDPTPQEAAAAAAVAASVSHKPLSSDSGGEDSAKENKEMPTDRSDSGKGAKKKGW